MEKSPCHLNQVVLFLISVNQSVYAEQEYKIVVREQVSKA
jgi:hypothetical protein